MSFIVRNLGWILLLVFFLFMLFVISSNNRSVSPQDITATGNVTEEKEDLDNLVEMIEENSDEEEGSDSEENGEDMEEEKGFFAKLFSRGGEADSDQELLDDMDSQENIDISDGSNENVVEKSEDETVVEESEKEEAGIFSKLFGGANDREDIIEITKDTPADPKGNLLKDTNTEMSADSKKLIALYAPEMLHNSLPGVNLETEIGKEFMIGVHSLKLNNKYFNQTLGYLMNGDKVTQLSNENVYGCFQVEVIHASNNANEGKLGYVCKKYLQEVSDNISVVEESVETSEETSQIGQIITVEVPSVTFGDGIQLVAGDMVDQMTPADENGCFTAHVYSSATIPSVVPVGTLCLSDIK